MEKIKFVTDSASDISLEDEAEYGIKVLNYKITVGDKGYLSRIDVSNRQFYDILEKSQEIPKTSQIFTYEFTELFEELYKDGYTHVIMTLINKDASATFQNAETAIEEFYSEHPGAKQLIKIKLIDSRNYTYGYGYPVIEGVKMADRGISYDDIVKYIENWLKHLVIYFVPYTLKYAKKSGRIPGAVAVVGEALGIKPIMRIYDHVIANSVMARGEKKVVPTLVDKTMSEIIEGTPYITLCGCEEKDGNAITAAMTEAIGYPPERCVQIGPVISSHSGPRVSGVVFQSKFAK